MEISLKNLALAFEIANEAARTESIEAFVKSNEDANRVLRQLGVTVESDVQAKIERYENALEQLRIETDAGLRSTNELRAGEIAIAQAIEELTTGTKALTKEQEISTVVTEAQTEAFNDERRSIEGVFVSLQRLTSAQLARNVAAIGFARENQGGRIQLPGGGSRLIRPDGRGGVFTIEEAEQLQDANGGIIP